MSSVTAKEDYSKAVLGVTKAAKGALCTVHYQQDGAWPHNAYYSRRRLRCKAVLAVTITAKGITCTVTRCCALVL